MANQPLTEVEITEMKISLATAKDQLARDSTTISNLHAQLEAQYALNAELRAKINRHPRLTCYP
jgi:multidrug resistance efflux pump